jgi:hypothetical protein
MRFLATLQAGPSFGVGSGSNWLIAKTRPLYGASTPRQFQAADGPKPKTR